jgi:putative addiction module CopG family antidote
VAPGEVYALGAADATGVAAPSSRTCELAPMDSEVHPMTVILTPQAEASVRRLIESGQYPDAETVIDQALQALEEQARAGLSTLRKLVWIGHTSGVAGELTAEMWDEIERSSEERFRRGDVPSPHVRP